MDYTTLAKGPCANIGEAVGAFLCQGVPAECCRYGNGHINDTFLLTCMDRTFLHRYILQRMNTHVFKDPAGLMSNISGVTSFLRKQILENGGDADRETLTLVKTAAQADYYIDSIGSWWRMYLFIPAATTYDVVRQPEDFYESARAFGHFQRLLAQYPVEKLSETIPDFHNTPDRLKKLQKAIAANPCGRVQNVTVEISFVMDRVKDIPVITDMLSSGELPYRVTHNDTKLNNIMLDDQIRKAVCVIDLDTIMPGASAFDYGDSIRFGANTAAEDETDLSKVTLSLPLFDAYTKGFLEGCEGSLTETETAMLPWGARLMTLECGMRFLTDYLEGDTYFKIHRPDHNLDRARCQFALVADMERKWTQMANHVKSMAATSPFPTEMDPAAASGNLLKHL